jgi:hypothetical protein
MSNITKYITPKLLQKIKGGSKTEDSPGPEKNRRSPKKNRPFPIFVTCF